jgi:hypothetical protein
MDLLLKVVGAVWAVIGAANIVGMPWDKGSTGILTFGLMFNMLLFVIPGLVVYGIGAGISRRRRITTASQAQLTPTDIPTSTVGERLKTLQELKDKWLITEEEYASRRAEILRQV